MYLNMHYSYSSENEHFYSREILLYIAWVCLRNDKLRILHEFSCVVEFIKQIEQKKIR